MSAMKITKDNFSQEVLQSDQPVLLDFWAAWCGPCRMAGPVIEEIAEEQTGRVKVGKVNVDEEMELAQQFGISSIPTFLVFKNGKVANRMVGFPGKPTILNLL